MNQSKANPIFRITFIFTLLILLSCTENPVSQKPSGAQLSYRLNLKALHPDSLEIVLIAHNTGASEQRFILPAHFFDNPTDSFTGSTVKNLTVTDNSGRTLENKFTQEHFGPLSNQIFTVPPGTEYPVTFSYTYNPATIIQSSSPFFPRMHLDSTALLMGSYLFIIPYLQNSLSGLWRTPIDIELTASSNQSIEIYGLPHYSNYRNVYELLFTQLSAGAAPVFSGSTGKQAFNIVNLSEFNYSGLIVEQIANGFSKVINDVQSRFGTIRSQGTPYTVVLSEMAGALEGYNGFIALPPSPTEVNQEYFMVMAHELIHHYVGIRCGDLDDPWWKEGMTNYLGVVTSARLGLFSKEMTDNYLMKDSFNLEDYPVALSSSQVREEHFSKGYSSLIYTKGMWVSMLMDERIRKATDNRIILDDVIATLCRQFDGTAFSRRGFMETVSSFGNADINDIFSSYVDKPDSPIPPSILLNAYSYLDSAGAFGNAKPVISASPSKALTLKKF